MSDAKENLLNTAELALRELVATAAQAKDFAVEQIPDVVQQMLTYAAIKSGLLAVVFVSALVGGVLLLIRARREWAKVSEAHYSWRDVDVVNHITSIGAILIGAFIGFPALFGFIKVIVAPKLYLLEYAARLL